MHLRHGAPDPTMQITIDVVREAHRRKEPKSAPQGYLSVYNISALVEPNGEKIATYTEELSKV